MKKGILQPNALRYDLPSMGHAAERVSTKPVGNLDEALSLEILFDLALNSFLAIVSFLQVHLPSVQLAWKCRGQDFIDGGREVGIQIIMG